MKRSLAQIRDQQTHNPAGMSEVVWIRQIKFTEGADAAHGSVSFFVSALEKNWPDDALTQNIHSNLQPPQLSASCSKLHVCFFIAGQEINTKVLSSLALLIGLWSGTWHN